MMQKIAKGMIPILIFCVWVSGILLLSHTFPNETEGQSAGLFMLNVIWFFVCVFSGILLFDQFEIFEDL